MEDTPRRNLYLAAAICGLLLLIVAMVFGRSVQYGFVNFDDGPYVYENSSLQHGLTKDTVAWSFTTFHASNWHPVTWLSHALDCQLYGMQNAAGHHATNVVLHAAVAILLLLVLWQMTGNLWPSAFVAAVFAVHPLRVESVAWIAERKDLLCGLFFMLTLAAYLRYVRRPSSWGRYLAVVAMFALGLMAKPMLVTLPFVLLLLDYWPLGRTHVQALPSQQTWQSLIREKIPLVVLAAMSCMVTSAAQTQAIAVSERLPITSRVANALVTYVVYIEQFLCPTGLAVFYPHPENGLATWKVVGALLVLGGISAAAWIGRRRFPAFLVGWLWYLGMLVPVIGLVQVGDQALADRYTYLPQIGLCIAIAWGVAQLSLSWPHRRWVCGVASALTVTILAAIAFLQTSFWRDSETLWTRAVACTTHNATAQYNLGVTLAQRGDIRDAMKCFQEAIAAQPRSADAENNLGVLLAKSGRVNEAMGHFQAAVKLQPNLADAHKNLAMALEQQGRVVDAMAHWREIVRLQPGNLSVVNQLAWAMATRHEASARNGKEAAELAQWAVQLSHGRDPIPLGTLAAAYAESGRFADAVKAADRAIALAAARGDVATADTLRRQSQFYRTGSPYHELPTPHLP